MQCARQRLGLLKRTLGGREPRRDGAFERLDGMQQMMKQRARRAVLGLRCEMRLAAPAQFRFQHFRARGLLDMAGIAMQIGEARIVLLEQRGGSVHEEFALVRGKARHRCEFSQHDAAQRVGLDAYAHPLGVRRSRERIHARRPAR